MFRIHTDLYGYVLNLFENMHTDGLPHTVALMDSRTLPRSLLISRTLPHTLPHTAALPESAVRSAAHCCTLHEFECRTPHTAHRTPHTVAFRNERKLK
jgi:hypothetical protein